MACYYPQKAFIGENGRAVFIKNSSSAANTMTLPCGQCIGCRIQKSKEWAIRCVHEAQMHDENTYLTLTYDDDHLPKNKSLNHQDFQKFIRSLRKRTGKKIRYYMCGEYGDEFKRPHFHAILFGYRFTDESKLYYKNGNQVYSSAALDEIWGRGYCSIGEVTFQSAAYVARYLMKKQNGDRAASHYAIIDETTGEITGSRTPEYNRMSLKPGIGFSWYKKYKTDVFPHDYVVVQGKDGKPKEMQTPAYYRNLLKTEDPDLYEQLRALRIAKAKNNPLDQKARDPVTPPNMENSPKRLKAREICQEAKLNRLKRDLPQ